MPTYTRDGAEINYETHGSSERPAVLLIAPGGMKSAIDFWLSTPWNPIEALKDDFFVVAMDQRNAGQSRAPVAASDGWSTYTQDQLGLMTHLGIDRFHTAGMCIGGPYCLGMIEAAPERIISATLFQSIGRDDNREAFYAMFDQWAEPLKAEKGASEADWASFRENMYGGDRVLFNLDADFLDACTTPLLVLEGDDLYHPKSTSLLIRDRAPNVTYIESWKSGPASDAARAQCTAFLNAHA